MAVSTPTQEPGAGLTIAVLSVVPAAPDGQWKIRWQLRNGSIGSLALREVWHPHGKFQGARRVLDPPLVIPAQGLAEVESLARCTEQPGAVVENAFLILRFEDVRQQPWRILARLCVAVSDSGAPWPTVELLSTQRVGFSNGAGPPVGNAP